MSKIKNNSASNAGPKKGTDLHWEEIEKKGYTEGKATYNKRFTVRREIERLCRDSYCGDRNRVITIQLRAVGMKDRHILVCLTSEPNAFIIKVICADYNLDYDEVVKTLKRL